MQAKALKLGILAAAITGFTLGAPGVGYFAPSAHAQSAPVSALAGVATITLPDFRSIVQKYGPAPQAFRLGYAALDEGQIARAVEILAQSVPG